MPNTWPATLTSLLSAASGDWFLYQNGVQGSTVADWAGYVNTQLAACKCSRVSTRVVLIDLGANDVNGALDQSTWQNNYLAVADAVHTQFPNALAYITKPWRRGFDAQCDTLASWIDNVVASRTFLRVGDDERGWMKGADNGATYTIDGVHLSTAGQTEKPNQLLLLIPN